MKDNCFTEFCYFLSNLNMNQSYVYIYPLPFETACQLPHIPPLQVYTEPLFEFPEPYSKFLLAIYFTYGNVSFLVTLSIHVTLSSPLRNTGFKFLFNSVASLEKAMAPHSSTLAWKIPWMEEPGRLQTMGLRRVGHDWVTSLSLFPFMHWRRKWQPTLVFLPGESQGQGSLVGRRLWGRTESDTTEAT